MLLPLRLLLDWATRFSFAMPVFLPVRVSATYTHHVLKGVKNMPNTLGIPVISIGIPTVVSTSVIKGKNGGDGMFVTPREIDRIIEHGAKLIAMTVNVCLQKNIDAKDLFSLVG